MHININIFSLFHLHYSLITREVLVLKLTFLSNAKGAIEKRWYFAYAVSIKVQKLLPVFMVVVVDRVDVKKISVFSQTKLIWGRPSV